MRSHIETTLIECRPVFEYDDAKLELFCHKHATKIAEFSGDAETFNFQTWVNSDDVQTAWKERACK